MEDFVIKEGVHFVGKPCVKCGSEVRYVCNGKCVLCLATYYENNRIFILNRQRQYDEENKNYILEYKKEQYKENAQQKVEYNKQQYINKRQSRIAYSKQYAKNNPEKRKANKHRRRALKQNAEGSFTDQEWIELCNQYGNKCLSCGEQKPLEADHIVPLSKGGTNFITNIQPLCKSCNCSKHTKTIDYRT